MIYTFLDIETSGFGRNTDNILEVGYIRCNRDLQILSYDNFYFYKPGWKIGATEIHGLTREFLEPYEDQFEISLAKLYTVYRESNLIGKNSKGFDEPFILSFLSRYGTQQMKEALSYSYLDLQIKYTVTDSFREAYMQEHGVATNKKGTLEEYINYFLHLSVKECENLCRQQLPNVQDRIRPHAALFDAYMTYLITVWGVKQKGLRI